MSGCQAIGCSRAATHYPCLVVPAIGHRDVPKNCLELAIGLAACKEHAADYELARAMPEESKARIRSVMTAMQRVWPDFKRARVEARRLGDDMWLKFQQMQAQAEGGGTA